MQVVPYGRNEVVTPKLRILFRHASSPSEAVPETLEKRLLTIIDISIIEIEANVWEFENSWFRFGCIFAGFTLVSHAKLIKFIIWLYIFFNL
jgi:hypothetical protein